VSILVDSQTRVITQGMTGDTGTFHTRQALAYGTPDGRRGYPRQGRDRASRPAGVRHRRRGGRATGANASVIYVPPPFAADSILEAIDAEVPLIVCITEGIPVLDMVKVKRALCGSKSRLIGPNCPGVLTPDECKIGIMPGNHLQQGQRRRGQPLGHADLRSGVPDHQRGPGPIDRGRHRRRSGQGHRVHRHARDVPCRRRDRSRSS
jgi:succinyl-CoA synthetase alpha subunit